LYLLIFYLFEIMVFLFCLSVLITVFLTNFTHLTCIFSSPNIHCFHYSELTERLWSNCARTFCRTSTVPTSPSLHLISIAMEQIRDRDCVQANSVRIHCKATVTKHGYSLLKPVTWRVTRECRNSNSIPTHSAPAASPDSRSSNCSVSLEKLQEENTAAYIH
jgi:hypothetical protein